MAEMMKTRPCVKRANSEGFEISEYALRKLIHTGAIPVRKTGRDYLIYYPNLIRYLKCEDGGDNQPATVAAAPGIRRVDL